MKSLIAAAQKAEVDQLPLSVRKLAKRFQVPEPISLLRLIEELTPDQLIFNNNNVTDEGVSWSAQLGLLSSGWWSLKGQVTFPPAAVLPIQYVFGVVLNQVDELGHVRGVKAEGQIGEDGGTESVFQLNLERDPWIGANLGAIRNKGVTWDIEFEAIDDFGPFLTKILEGVLTAAFVVGAVFLGVAWGQSEAAGNCHNEFGTDPATGAATFTRVCN